MSDSNDSITIRPFQEKDEPQVIALWKRVFPDDPPWNDPHQDIQRKLRIQRELFLVGELAGRVKATVMAGFDGHRGWVYLVAVAPECRQRGLGRAMLKEAERRL